MARQKFTINAEPHVAEVGDVELYFEPEVMGDEYLEQYGELQRTHATLAGTGSQDLANTSPEKLREINDSLRNFLAGLMLPESADRFSRFEVISRGKTAATYRTRAEAESHAATLKGAKVIDASIRLPTRVLIELLEWCIELYGGGRPPTSSSGSAAPSPPPGKAGKVSSRSRASTRTAGR